MGLRCFYHEFSFGVKTHGLKTNPLKACYVTWLCEMGLHPPHPSVRHLHMTTFFVGCGVECILRGQNAAEGGRKPGKGMMLTIELKQEYVKSKYL